MSGTITIRPSFYLDTTSVDVSVGREVAQDAWLSIAKGKSEEDAAAAFVEEMMAVVLGEPQSVAAALYGVASLFLEFAGKPVLTEAAAQS